MIQITPPTNDEIVTPLDTIIARTVAMLKRMGRLDDEAIDDEADRRAHADQKALGRSHREVAASLRVSAGVVGSTAKRAGPAEQIRELAVLELYRRQVISSGKAAELLHHDRGAPR